MTQPLRIAFFVGTFPVVSETFIIRQIAGLLDMGHEVDIYSDCRADPNQPVHPEVAAHRLLERTTFMDLPPEMAPYEISIWPIGGQTWPPGAEQAIPNASRLLRAIPVFFKCLAQHPRLTFQTLDAAEYGCQAASLSALYRFTRLSAVRKRYDVLHAHFGPVA